METFLGALLVFLLRITDVSIGTIRVIYTVRGQRLAAASLGFLEAGIFVFAISRVLQQADQVRMVGYAAGFAVGTAVGITVEQWIASGITLVRIVSRQKSSELVQCLRSAGFGVTCVPGEGKEGDLTILFVVAPRRRGKELLGLVQGIESTAFITMDPVNKAIGGYLHHVAPPAGVRK